MSLDARLSYDLLVTIFNPTTPLHDGAVVIQRERIAAASVFLPLTKNPSVSRELGTRNLFFGVGMDSAKRFKEAWHLFDNGRLEASHFHSTPLQLLVERGLPALLLWLWILGVYARTLWWGIQGSKFKIQNTKSLDRQTKGIILGCFGGLVGFFVSSLVNYSLGDSEVAMVFFLLMGLSVSLVIQDSKSDSTI